MCGLRIFRTYHIGSSRESDSVKKEHLEALFHNVKPTDTLEQLREEFRVMSEKILTLEKRTEFLKKKIKRLEAKY